MPGGYQGSTASDVPDQFEMQQSVYNYDTSLASSDSTDSLPFDTLIDSPETVTLVVYSQSAYENDEAFFDTSNADTIYRAKNE
jgi:hypothetical protein